MFSALATASQLGLEQQRQQAAAAAAATAAATISHSRGDVRESGDDWNSPYHVNLLEQYGRPIELYGSPEERANGTQPLATGHADTGPGDIRWSQSATVASSVVTEPFSQHRQLAQEAATERANSGFASFLRRGRLRTWRTSPQSGRSPTPSASEHVSEPGDNPSTSSHQESGSSPEASVGAMLPTTGPFAAPANVMLAASSVMDSTIASQSTLVPTAAERGNLPTATASNGGGDLSNETTSSLLTGREVTSPPRTDGKVEV